ncbi:MAG TPA: hypothetical protein VM469_02715 [Pseudoxanthomonas sp.]|jgi:hypothetical protein|nr:hypothetical protein [Pseudoxanthomonas sp.]
MQGRDFRLDRRPTRWEQILGIVAAFVGFILLALLSAALLWIGASEGAGWITYAIGAVLSLISLFCLRVFVRAAWGRPERPSRRAYAIASWCVLVMGLSGIAAGLLVGNQTGLIASGTVAVVMGALNLARLRA